MTGRTCREPNNTKHSRRFNQQNYLIIDELLPLRNLTHSLQPKVASSSNAMPPKKRKMNQSSAALNGQLPGSSGGGGGGPVSGSGAPGGGGGGAESGPRKLSLRFGGCIYEDHKQPVWTVSFFEPLPAARGGKGGLGFGGSGGEVPAIVPQFFSAVGANRATVQQWHSFQSRFKAQDMEYTVAARGFFPDRSSPSACLSS